jgi:hypothetical protein
MHDMFQILEMEFEVGGFFTPAVNDGWDAPSFTGFVHVTTGA